MSMLSQAKNQILSLKNRYAKRNSNGKVNRNKGPALSTITVEDILYHLNISLEEFVKRDKENGWKLDSQIAFYHGKLTRDDAERLLKDSFDPPEDGVFLIRQSTKNDDYALSMMFDGECIHYQIQQHYQESTFNIDQGPLINGLEMLVDHYREDADHGLPCKLTQFCKCKPPPPSTRKYGRNTVFHRCVDQGNLLYVRELVRLALIGDDLVMKNGDGLMALHGAAIMGYVDIVRLLLELGTVGEDEGGNPLPPPAEYVNCKDSFGYTPLQRACMSGHSDVVKVLLEVGQANPQERHSHNGWVALHHAASKGHTQCVRVLLSQGVAHRCRTSDNETAEDVARQQQFPDTANILQQHRAHTPPPSMGRQHWLYHGTAGTRQLDRQDAVKLLLKQHLSPSAHTGPVEDGRFLVRKSQHYNNVYVLSITSQQNVYNFEIKQMLQPPGGGGGAAVALYYIDDGPLFNSLEHVIEHHMKYADGLPTVLTTPVQPLHATTLRYLDMRTAAAATVSADGLGSGKPPVPGNKPQLGRPAAATGSTYSLGGPTPHSKTPQPQAQQDDATNINRTNRKMWPKQNVLVQIKKECIQLGAEIGQGEFGSVFRGVWSNSNGDRVAVAIKTLREESMVSGKNEFLREAAVMIRLRHPCIIKLIGICSGPPLMIVQELALQGSLLDYLLEHCDEVETADLKLWAAQIAWGMMYLEKRKFVHRDLAARNILLHTNRQVKISDFGLSRSVGVNSDYYKSRAGGRWPVKWYAPESINYGTFSHASDVWSYGITLWEMFSFGEPPYGELAGAQVLALIERGERLERPPGEECPQKVYKIMLQCWSYAPQERPTFRQLHSIFTTDPEYAQVKDFIQSLSLQGSRSTATSAATATATAQHVND